MGRWSVLGRAAIGVAATAGIVVAGPAVAHAGSAPAPESQALRVTAPARNAFITTSSFLVVVRAHASVRNVRALVDGRSVRLRRAAAGRWSARLVTRRLRPGIHVVSARGRLGRRTLKAAEHFVVPGRRRDLLALSAPSRVGRGPLAVTAHTRSARGWFRAYLNGRRIDDQFEYPRHGLRRASLSPGEGLRFGRNRLEVRAYRPDGAHERIVRTITVPRLRPLASAGRDRGIRLGRRVTLDASATRRARAGTVLRYRWSFVRRPRGSRARIASPTARRTTFRPDRRGRYRVRLTVTETPRAGRRGRSAGAASSDSDVANVVAIPSIPPIGVPVNTYKTIDDSSWIAIGGYIYPYTFNAITVVVFDRTSSQGASLEAVYMKFDGGDEAELLAYLRSLDNTKLVVAASYGTATSASGAAALNQAIAEIGGSSVPWDDGATGPFAIVGIPGAKQNSAYQTTQPVGNTPLETPPPAMQGYLTRDSSSIDAILSGYTFSPADYVPFQLAANGVTIGCTGLTPFCTQANPPTPSPGFQVVVVDSFSLAQVDGGGFGTDAASLQNMANLIDEYDDMGNRLIMIRSVGGPSPSNTSWNLVANELASLGANWNDFNTLNPPNQASGPANYAFVGGEGVDPAEGYGANPSAPIALGGILAHQQDWTFAPLVFDALSAFNYSLQQIAYQPTSAQTAFPYSTGDYAAAEAYIAEKLSCPTTPPPPDGPCQPWPDIRSMYWASDTTWSTYATAVNDVDYRPGLGFSEGELNQVKAQLVNVEFPAVDAVSQMMSDLYEPFAGATPETTLNVQQIADDITRAVNPPNDDTTTKVLETFQDVLAIGQSVAAVFAHRPRTAPPRVRAALNDQPVPDPPDDNPIAAGAAGGLGIASGVFGLVATWTDDDNGDRVLSEIQSTAAELSSDFGYAIAQSQIGLARLRELLVSDYGKLIAAADLKNSELPWDADQQSAVFNSFFQAMNQRIYKTLMPVAFDGLCLGAGSYPLPLVVEFAGDPGQVRPVLVKPVPTSSFGPLSDYLFTAPTFTAGDINAGFRWSDFWTHVLRVQPSECGL